MSGESQKVKLQPIFHFKSGLLCRLRLRAMTARGRHCEWSEAIQFFCHLIDKRYHLIKNLVWPASILVFFTLPLVGKPPSLFFTETETNFIKNKFLFQKKLEKAEIIKPENLYLSAILYVDEAHWTLWVNHQVVHASDTHPIPGYRIEKVTPLSVVFSHTSPPSRPKLFTLRAHDMYLSTENKIIKINK